jgi:hypothetical protein
MLGILAGICKTSTLFYVTVTCVSGASRTRRVHSLPQQRIVSHLDRRTQESRPPKNPRKSAVRESNPASVNSIVFFNANIFRMTSLKLRVPPGRHFRFCSRRSMYGGFLLWFDLHRLLTRRRRGFGLSSTFADDNCWSVVVVARVTAAAAADDDALAPTSLSFWRGRCSRRQRYV